MDRQENEEKRKKKKWLLLLLLLLLLFIITIVGTITFLKGDKRAEATGTDAINFENNSENIGNNNEENNNQEQNDDEDMLNNIEEENKILEANRNDNRNNNTNGNTQNNNVVDNGNSGDNNNSGNSNTGDNKNNNNSGNINTGDNGNNNNPGDNNTGDNGSNNNLGDNNTGDTGNNNNPGDNNSGNNGNNNNPGDNNSGNNGNNNNPGDDENDNKKPEDNQKKYIVTFVDYDGNVLKTQEVKDRETAIAPEDPTREGYTFTGWDKAFANITADTTITAQYEINKYTVTFVDYDGKELNKQIIEYNKAATEPEKLTREGYTFTGWDKEFTNITENITITAQYRINKYKVTFVEDNGTIIDSQIIEYNKSALEPNVPPRRGYTFIGWDKTFVNITADITITAQYEINKYTVTFVDYNGKELNKQTIEYNKAATAPEGLTRTGYTFTGWDKEFANITADITITAQYEINKYTVTFVDYNGKELSKQTVEYNKAAKAPKNPTRTGYTFTGWDKTFANITADITITTQYEINKYTVTFVDYNGKELNKQTIEYNKAATAPKNPTRTGYTFKGWDKAFTNITADITITAQYEINKYTVTFVDYNGKELNKQTIEYNKAATAPKNPTRTGYTFTGWDKTFANITADITITAQYEINKYTVTFVDYNGKELSKQTVEYNKAATAPKNPTRTGYTFTGWDKTFTNITADITITAQYKKETLELKKDGIIKVSRTKDDFGKFGTDKNHIKFHYTVELNNIVKDTSIISKYIISLYDMNGNKISEKTTTAKNNVKINLDTIDRSSNSKVFGDKYSVKIEAVSASGSVISKTITLNTKIIITADKTSTTVRFEIPTANWYTISDTDYDILDAFGYTKASLKLK